jgi:hypothetical protein
MTKEECKPIRSPCSECGGSTMHDVMCTHTVHGPEEYHCAIYYMVVQCRGCSNTSFRYVFRDYESAYPTSENEWEVPETIKTYPKFLASHRELDGTHFVPDIVREIYEESLTAIQEGAEILSCLGLRGTIDAICNDRKNKRQNS